MSILMSILRTDHSSDGFEGVSSPFQNRCVSCFVASFTVIEHYVRWAAASTKRNMSTGFEPRSPQKVASSLVCTHEILTLSAE